ncbi:MAG: sulfite exporter TauE/SafE family protein [Bdellovibrionota bacterium]
MLAQLHNTLWIIPVAVLSASFLGSVHCAVMCGPLVMNFAKTKKQMFLYQTGRAFTYVIAGASAGALGNSVFDNTQAPVFSIVGLAILSIALLYTSYHSLVKNQIHLPSTYFLNRILQPIWLKLSRSHAPKAYVAFLSGAFTVFLPCGHLYAFLAGAMATGSAMTGAIFMATFWLGTLPTLVFGPTVIRYLVGERIFNSKRVFGIVILFAGIISLANFTTKAISLKQVASHHNSDKHQSALSCH